MKLTECFVLLGFIKMGSAYVRGDERSSLFELSKVQWDLSKLLLPIKTCSDFFGGIERSSKTPHTKSSECPANYTYNRVNRCYGIKMIAFYKVSDVMSRLAENIVNESGNAKVRSSLELEMDPNRFKIIYKLVEEFCAKRCNELQHCKMFGFEQMCYGQPRLCHFNLKERFERKHCILSGIAEGGHDLTSWVHICYKTSEFLWHLLVQYNIKLQAHYVHTGILVILIHLIYVRVAFLGATVNMMKPGDGIRPFKKPNKIFGNNTAAHESNEQLGRNVGEKKSLATTLNQDVVKIVFVLFIAIRS